MLINIKLIMRRFLKKNVLSKFNMKLKKTGKPGYNKKK